MEDNDNKIINEDISYDIAELVLSLCLYDHEAAIRELNEMAIQIAKKWKDSNKNE